MNRHCEDTGGCLKAWRRRGRTRGGEAGVGVVKREVGEYSEKVAPIASRQSSYAFRLYSL